MSEIAFVISKRRASVAVEDSGDGCAGEGQFGPDLVQQQHGKANESFEMNDQPRSLSEVSIEIVAGIQIIQGPEDKRNGKYRVPEETGDDASGIEAAR